MNRLLTVISDGSPCGGQVLDAEGRRIAGVTRVELTLTPDGCTGVITFDALGVQIARGRLRPQVTRFRRPRFRGRL